MGRELQKKKKRSSIPKIKLKPKSKRVNPLGNPIIAANWNQSETLTQNYRRLGLTSRLNTATGGIEKLHPTHTSVSTSTSTNGDAKSSKKDKLSISNAIPKEIAPTEARVERDPTTGKILRVIHPSSGKNSNPLNDPLNSSSDDDSEAESESRREKRGIESDNPIIKQLEAQAQSGRAKRERKQSEREREWIESLVKRWGENYGGMVRDRALNPMQQTEGDLRKRVARWRASGGEVIG